jgi:hypothetical protein
MKTVYFRGVFSCFHPQVPRLGKALARAGFAALLYWSPARCETSALSPRTSRISRWRIALAGQAGVHYTEMLFQHLDPVKGKLPLFRLVRELGKFFLAVYPMFRQAVAS